MLEVYFQPGTQINVFTEESFAKGAVFSHKNLKLDGFFVVSASEMPIVQMPL